MTDTTTIANTTRVYTRINGDHEETVYLHETPDGYIRMKADNMHHVLIHLGFQPVGVSPQHEPATTAP